jgi:phage baseplate assembly protein W
VGTVNGDRLGTDLRLLTDLERQDSRRPGSDLVTITPEGRAGTDLDIVSGARNLQQALLLRFLTRVGDLAPLGHADYGSRLFELIGELNSDTNRNRAKLFVLQALAAEPRVKEVRSVLVTQSPNDRTRMDIAISLVPIDGDVLLDLVFPFFLSGGVGR